MYNKSKSLEIDSAINRWTKKINTHSNQDFTRGLKSFMGTKPYKGINSNTFIKALNNKKAVFQITGVLASITALQELEFMLSALRKFDSHLKVDINLLLLEWPILVSHSPTSFIRVSTEITRITKASFHASTITPLSLQQVQNTPMFKDIQNKTWKELLEDEGDTAWLIKFYERQHSFNKLGPHQAIFDITMRKFIGAYINKNLKNTDLVLLTEIKDRLSKCYRLQSSSFNVKINTQAIKVSSNVA
jgi:hypothetical protein